jgi:hypothetical protein
MELPFHDEKSFKRWQAVEKVKASAKPQPPPSDSDAPTAEEIAMTDDVSWTTQLQQQMTLHQVRSLPPCSPAHPAHLPTSSYTTPCHATTPILAQLEAMVRPELKAELRDGMLTRFVRGYALRSFVAAPDRLERTGVMLNMCLEWRKEVDANRLPFTELAKRAEWDRMKPECFPGLDADGRVVYYIGFPADLTVIPMVEAKQLHFQDMLRLELVKVHNSQARAAQGLPVRHHHVLILDLGNPDSALGRALLNWFKELVSHPKGPSITQHFFPDMLERAVIINAPFLFRALWSVAKLFIEPETAVKYQIVGSSFESTLEGVGISKGTLPMALGGLAPNAPGQMCSLKLGKGAVELAVLHVPVGTTAVKWIVVQVKGSECTVQVLSQADGEKAVVVGTTFEGGVPVNGSSAVGTKIIIELQGSAAGSSTVKFTLIPQMAVPWGAAPSSGDGAGGAGGAGGAK